MMLKLKDIHEWDYTHNDEFNQRANELFDNVLKKWNMWDEFTEWEKCHVEELTEDGFKQTLCHITGELNSCTSCIQSRCHIEHTVWHTTKKKIYTLLDMYTEPPKDNIDNLLDDIKKRQGVKQHLDAYEQSPNVDLFVDLVMLFQEYGMQIPIKTN